MIREFAKLTPAEQELLFKAPALVSVLASCLDHEINQSQKADAMELAHLKTFTADPSLRTYYKEVENSFRQNFESTAGTYTPFDDSKREKLKEEIQKVYRVLGKLDKNFAGTLYASLQKYAEHIRRADHSILETFVLPIPIHGLND